MGITHHATTPLQQLNHMSFILDPKIHTKPHEAVQERFMRYREYLGSIQERLPAGAREYVLAEYYICGDNECPHNSWLDNLTMEVAASGKRSEIRSLNIHVRLLGSYHNGYIEFHYRNVYDCSIVAVCEWMYDEVRLSKKGNVIHEIRFDANSLWKIECEDFSYEWKPFEQTNRENHKRRSPKYDPNN